MKKYISKTVFVAFLLGIGACASRPSHRFLSDASYEAGMKAYEQGLFSEAESALWSALKSAQGEEAPNSRAYQTLLALGRLYGSQGRLAESEWAYGAALHAAREVWGPLARESIVAAYLLGDVVSLRGRADDAESYFVTGLGAALEGQGPDSPLLAEGLIRVGHLYCNRGNCIRAGAFFERARRILEGSARGRVSKNQLALCYFGLSRARLAAGDKAGSEIAQREADRIRFEMFGKLLASREPISRGL